MLSSLPGCASTACHANSLSGCFATVRLMASGLRSCACEGDASRHMSGRRNEECSWSPTIVQLSSFQFCCRSRRQERLVWRGRGKEGKPEGGVFVSSGRCERLAPWRIIRKVALTLTWRPSTGRYRVLADATSNSANTSWLAWPQHLDRFSQWSSCQLGNEYRRLMERQPDDSNPVTFDERDTGRLGRCILK